jgi:hypothetical protein
MGRSLTAGAVIVSRSSSPNTRVAASRYPASTTTSTSTTTTLPPTTEPLLPPTTAPPPPTVPPFAGITLDEYNQIANGMPYPQVVTLLSDAGTLISQYQGQTDADRLAALGSLPCEISHAPGYPCPQPTPSYHTFQDYQWTNNRGGQAVITFVNGAVYNETESVF